jgi:eukaryotic-like serine/threonine-protein kinase
MTATPATATMPSAPPGSSWALGRGDVLAPGRRIVRRLGGGAAHEAFLVDTGGPCRLAAAKLPRPHLAEDPHCLLGLRGEARALERLAHPTVPAHLDTVLSGPYPHLLIAYVPGPTLQDILVARRSLDRRTVASLGCTLARGLAHIAELGWVHLDVKPSNIVLDILPHLVDFELARPAAEATRMNSPAGTWAYMAPEQRAAGAGHAPAIGPAADVFALAASLHEALGGGLPPRPRAPRPAAFQSGIGALLDDALAPAPGDRPTAAELAEGLAQFAEPPTWQPAAA